MPVLGEILFERKTCFSFGENNRTFFFKCRALDLKQTKVVSHWLCEAFKKLFRIVFILQGLVEFGLKP